MTYRVYTYRKSQSKMREIDIEEIGAKLDEHLKKEYAKPTVDDVKKFGSLIHEIAAYDQPLQERQLRQLLRKYKFNHKRSFLFQIYLLLLKDGQITDEKQDVIRKSLQIKPCKSWSGITSITIFTSPFPEFTNDFGERVKQSFSCAFDCHYCPKEPGQPRSYLKGEPGVLRANKNEFDCVRQMRDRMNALFMIGSSPLKCEIIVSGGTWTSYPMEYRQEFCRDIYYAANTFWEEGPPRGRLALEEEKLINQSATSRIVGLTIETRPDTVDAEELKSFRKFGVTRVQLGVQHIDDDILTKVNRKCQTKKTIKAIELLKRNCFKIDTHWMPNLPGSSPEKDRHMFIEKLLGLKTPIVKRHTVYSKQSWMDYLWGRPRHVVEEWEEYDLTAPELSTDQWKIYPTAVTPWTEIEKWFKEGSYVQYSEEEVFSLIYDVMCLCYPWIRLNRVIRDIPCSYIYNENTGSDNTNMRQELDDVLRKDGMHCMDIRNREVKNKEWGGSYTVVIRKYNGSGGHEYFISAESKDNKTLYGFVRLRLDDGKDKVFKELDGAALIRELHVYGDLSKVGNKGSHVQHKGIGQTLMTRAEELARSAGYRKIAVISSEGTKMYYREKLGYWDTGAFMMKPLS